MARQIAIRIASIAFAVAAALGPSQAQTLRIGLADDPDMLDPTLGRTFSGRMVFAALCDKLFDIDEQLRIVPQLATRYEWSADNKTLTLRIREGDARNANGDLPGHVVLPPVARSATAGAIGRL